MPSPKKDAKGKPPPGKKDGKQKDGKFIKAKKKGDTKKKESAVLTDASLSALAKEIAVNGLTMCMYLNIPTTRLVNIRLEGSANGQGDDAMVRTMLLYWKEMRATAKDKDKVADLERALREIGKQEIADIVQERHKDAQELQPDCFPQP